MSGMSNKKVRFLWCCQKTQASTYRWRWRCRSVASVSALRADEEKSVLAGERKVSAFCSATRSRSKRSSYEDMSVGRLSCSPYLKKPGASEEVAGWIKANYPVCKMVIYAGGCVEVLRKGHKSGPNEGRKERPIIKMSDKAIRRLMFAANRCTVDFGAMMTLTYPKIFPQNGEIVKRDLNAILQKMRAWGFKYLWFLEFQKRGAPHVHILVDSNYISPRMRASFALSWSMRIAKSAWFQTQVKDEDFHREVMKVVSVNLHEEAWQLIRDENGARNYVMKYASKLSQKKVPEHYENVGRFWGISRDALPAAVEYVEVTERQVREWLEQVGHPAKDWHLIPRFLWGAEKEQDVNS